MKKFYVLILLTFLTIPFELIATVYYVRTDGNDKKSGLSWENAFADFQKALNVAKYGDEIWVAEGTYKPSITYGLNTDERGKHFMMVFSLNIFPN